MQFSFVNNRFITDNDGNTWAYRRSGCVVERAECTSFKAGFSFNVFWQPLKGSDILRMSSNELRFLADLLDADSIRHNGVYLVSKHVDKAIELALKFRTDGVYSTFYFQHLDCSENSHYILRGRTAPNVILIDEEIPEDIIKTAKVARAVFFDATMKDVSKDYYPDECANSGDSHE